MHDPVHRPARYTVYPVEPIDITRHLGFCLGNAVKYVLRAPYKGGEEDCRKALQYLKWEGEIRQPPVSLQAYNRISEALEALQEYLVSEGDALWDDISGAQSDFLTALDAYLHQDSSVCRMEEHVEELARILALCDMHDPVYANCTGLPTSREER